MKNNTQKRDRLEKTCWKVVAASVILMLLTILFFSNHEYSTPIITISFSVASALMSTALVVLLFEVVLRKEAERETRETLGGFVDMSISKAFGLKSNGVNAVHDSFDESKFIASAKRSQNIFILQTYAPNLAGIRPAILDVLDRGGAVKLAVLDPQSDFVAIRARETSTTHKTVDSMKSEIETSSIDRFKTIVSGTKKGKAKAQLALYNRSPGVCIYATDELMMISPFLTNMDAVSAPQVEISSDSKGYEIFVAHFRSIWDSSKLQKL